MTDYVFRKATKAQAKLRLAIYGPSGSGKTYTALRIATGLGGNVALIDTEHGSASKYADRFEFSTLDLPEPGMAAYTDAIKAAQGAGFSVLIVDSLSHAWYALLEWVEKQAKARYSGNTWSAWSEGNPIQRNLVNALLGFEGHLIATMRTKTEWTVQADERTGKTKPVRVGLAPEQGKGIEFEFDMLIGMNEDHVATVLKDRTGKYQDAIIEKPSETFGQALASWLQEGIQPSAPQPATPQQQASSARRAAGTPEQVRGWLTQKALAIGMRGTKASEGQRGAMVGALERLFPGEADDMAKQCRYSLLKVFFGVDSSKDLTDSQVLALLAWAQTQDGSGNFVPDPVATTEAARIIGAVTLAAGQQGLAL